MKNKDGYSDNEVVAQDYFKGLGFSVSIPRKSLRKGYDFEISLTYDNEIFSKHVEAKGSKSESLIIHQLDILKNGGLLVVSNNGIVKGVYTEEDIQEVKEVKLLPRYTIKWRAKQ